MSDLDIPESDTRDLADAFVILDGHDVRLAICETCGFAACICCRFCNEARAPRCACDHDPISQRDDRQMQARAGVRAARYRR